MSPLTPKERVLTAIRYQEADRLPRGELLVEDAFLNRLYPESEDAPYPEKMRRLAAEVGLDLITVKIDDEEGLKELSEWAIETPYFVMALIDGLFWRNEDPLSFEEFILGISRGKERVRDLIRIKTERALNWIRRCLDEGAHGVIVGDDLAYNRGPFISPKDLGEWIFPGLREMAELIREGGGIAFLHSCGNLSRVLDQILSSGFDGLHGLATSAGNVPLTVRQETYGRLTLMGVFEVDRLKPHEIAAMKKEFLQLLATGGGYIFGSTEGLSVNTPLDSFSALYSFT